MREQAERVVICVVDLETTGFTPPAAAVCEIGYQEIEATGRDLAGGAIDWQLGGCDAVYVNPGHPIPAETSAIHHIIDEDVAEARTFDSVADEIFGAAPYTIAYAAHNAKFERQFIGENYTGKTPWICTYKCALRIWPDAPAHFNQALRYHVKPSGIDREFASATHRALPDAYVTAFLLIEMLKLHSVEELVKWSREPALQVKCHIGKYRGTPWADIDSGFLRWILDRDFDEDVHFTCKHHLDLRAQKAREEAQVA
jgi:exodeoxyribonuclease X